MIKTIQNHTNTALSVRGVGKAYTIKKGLQNQSTLAETALQRLKNPLARGTKETFWALQDIDLDIKKGEVVGIIGRNGAGKSTLLKVLSRITYPTTGEIDIYGRVGSLLEVGTGFHPELTGRENIYLNGSILGMNRGEIKKQFDEIVDFAGVEKFLETPVKRYSSGMYVRLAFAVAANLSSEILIVDEVLAVGDAEFQAKCLGKMRDIAGGEGRTVLFVSHNMGSVRNLCTRAIWLKQGQIHDSGSVERIAAAYMASQMTDVTSSFVTENGIHLHDVSLSDPEGNLCNTVIFGDDMKLNIKLSSKDPFERTALVVRIFDVNGEVVSSVCTPEEGIGPFTLHQPIALSADLSKNVLLPGRYSVGVFIYRPNDMKAYLEVPSAMHFIVEPGPINGGMWAYKSEHGTCRAFDNVSVDQMVSA